MRIKAPLPLGLIALALAGLALLSGGCSKTSSPHPPSASTSSGRDAIKGYAFAPARLTVRVGTRVTWTNHDATPHTATADQGGFDTGTIDPGQSRTVSFTRPGTYTYHCAFHAFMTATITVTG